MTRPKKKDKYFSQRGVAIVAASVAIAFLSAIAFEFGSNTNVDLIAAKNAENDMKAHFLARSGMNLSELVIQVQTQVLDKYRNQIGDIQLADYMGLFTGAFGGSKEELDGFAALLGAGSSDALKGLGVPEGNFDLQIATEDGKINVNCGRDGTDAKNLFAQMWALFENDAYNPIFENEDGEGWRRDRETQIAAFIDYVDNDKRRFDPGESGVVAPEDYGYETLRDKYKSKDNYLDTVGEIRQIRGVDDRFWTLFGHRFTVYGGCKLNLGAVDDVGLLAMIIVASVKDENDPILQLQNRPRLWALAGLVKQARDFGFPLSRRDEFIQFVAAPNEMLEGLLSNPANQVPGAATPQINAPPVEGVELDPAKLGQITTEDPRRTYRVEAIATIGNTTKRIVGVWDKNFTSQNHRFHGNQKVTARDKGYWVYWKED